MYSTGATAHDPRSATERARTFTTRRAPTDTATNSTTTNPAPGTVALVGMPANPNNQNPAAARHQEPILIHAAIPSSRGLINRPSAQRGRRHEDGDDDLTGGSRGEGLDSAPTLIDVHLDAAHHSEAPIRLRQLVRAPTPVCHAEPHNDRRASAAHHSELHCGGRRQRPVHGLRAVRGAHRRQGHDGDDSRRVAAALDY